MYCVHIFFFFSSRRRHTRCSRDWSSDVCSSDLEEVAHVVADRSFTLQPVVAGEHAAPIQHAKALGDDSRLVFSLRERSEERRVGKECRSRWWPYPQKKKE